MLRLVLSGAAPANERWVLRRGADFSAASIVDGRSAAGILNFAAPRLTAGRPPSVVTPIRRGRAE
jgi:hypothetical protein